MPTLEKLQKDLELLGIFSSELRSHIDAETEVIDTQANLILDPLTTAQAETATSALQVSVQKRDTARRGWKTALHQVAVPTMPTRTRSVPPAPPGSLLELLLDQVDDFRRAAADPDKIVGSTLTSDVMGDSRREFLAHAFATSPDSLRCAGKKKGEPAATLAVLFGGNDFLSKNERVRVPLPDGRYHLADMLICYLQYYPDTADAPPYDGPAFQMIDVISSTGRNKDIYSSDRLDKFIEMFVYSKEYFESQGIGYAVYGMDDVPDGAFIGRRLDGGCILRRYILIESVDDIKRWHDELGCAMSYNRALQPDFEEEYDAYRKYILDSRLTADEQNAVEEEEQLAAAVDGNEGLMDELEGGISEDVDAAAAQKRQKAA